MKRDWLLKPTLNTKGVKEIAVISTSDRIISSTNPKDIGKWIAKNKKEFKTFLYRLGKFNISEEYSKRENL